jgi:hypothetical protein
LSECGPSSIRADSSLARVSLFICEVDELRMLGQRGGHDDTTGLADASLQRVLDIVKEQLGIFSLLNSSFNNLKQLSHNLQCLINVQCYHLYIYYSTLSIRMYGTPMKGPNPTKEECAGPHLE